MRTERLRHVLEPRLISQAKRKVGGILTILCMPLAKIQPTHDAQNDARKEEEERSHREHPEERPLDERPPVDD